MVSVHSKMHVFVKISNLLLDNNHCSKIKTLKSICHLNMDHISDNKQYQSNVKNFPGCCNVIVVLEVYVLVLGRYMLKYTG